MENKEKSSIIYSQIETLILQMENNNCQLTFNWDVAIGSSAFGVYLTVSLFLEIGCNLLIAISELDPWGSFCYLQ